VRRLRPLAAAVLLGALPATAGAATILGKQRPETVRGTARVDLVDVVGGGRDTVSCGRGVDTVMADPGDRVAADCEVVARRIATDRTRGPGAHATIVEPSAAASGSRVVAVFQAGRRSEGADAIGFATSSDAGVTWTSGLLPVTATGGGPWAVASDPVVAWDALHRLWVATALAFSDASEAIVATTSADGIHWGAPAPVVQEPLNEAQQVPLDKEWAGCDGAAASPRRGTCYVVATAQPDTISARLAVWSSSDGATWKAGATLADGYYAQTAVRPDGTLVVFYLDQARRVYVAAASADGGATFATAVDVAPAFPDGHQSNLRAPTLPSLAVGKGGELVAVWPGCTDVFCASEGIELSRSDDDGATWSPPRMLALGAGLHVVPALAADPVTGRLALTDYVASGAGCCAIVAQVARSRDGGATWTARRASVRPFQRSWLAPALGGSFLGDYVATVFAGGRAVSVLPLAEPPAGKTLREDLYAVRS
jgi:hypothetical protein